MGIGSSSLGMHGTRAIFFTKRDLAVLLPPPLSTCQDCQTGGMACDRKTRLPLEARLNGNEATEYPKGERYMSIDDSTVWLRREGGADVDGGGAWRLALA